MYIISAVIEKDQTKVALYDKEYKLLIKRDGDFADIAKLCSEVISAGGIKSSDVDYAGIAADTSFGAPSSIASELEKNIGIKCIGASLIDARALGEVYGLDDSDTLVMLKINNTVECGIVINKKLYTEEHKQSANIAHTVISFDGFECTCGRRGCFEAYASNAGLNRIAAESGVAGNITHKQLFSMNTPAAEKAKKIYVEYLAAGITNIINLFQPRYLVFEGPFAEVGDELMTPMMDIILREQYTHSMPNKGNIRFATTETDTALIGAALLGR